MTVVQSVFLEEIERLERNVFNYKKMLSSLPRGSIFIRKVGSSSFVYRKKKEHGKVISEYLGNLKDEHVINQINLSHEYKRIKGNIKTASAELCKLKKAYKVYDQQHKAVESNIVSSRKGGDIK